MSVTPVNPVNFMGDIVIDEGMRKTLRTPQDKQEAFSQMLAEEVFLKDVFSNDNSIYKPEPEEDDDSMGKGMTAIYGDFMRKQTAEYIVQQGFLKDGVKVSAGK